MSLQAKFFVFVAPVLLVTAVTPPVIWYWEQTHPMPSPLFYAGILLCAGLVVTALLTVYFAASFLVCRPMRRMAQEMNRICAGNDAEMLPEAYRSDELGLAAAAFNHVVCDLQWTTRALLAANADLERRVSERTGELAGRNIELILAEQKYRSIFENATEGIFQTSPDGRPLAANPAMVQMLGYDSEAQMMGSVHDLARQVYVRTADRLQLYQMLAKSNRVENFELELIRRDGDHIWVTLSATVVRDSSGNITRTQGFLRDVTEARKQRQQQQESELLELDRRAILEMIARDEPLPQTLETLCRAAERQWEYVRGMVLLKDATRRQVVAAPRLSAGFVLGIDSLLTSAAPGDTSALGSSAGFVPDITTDPHWAPLHKLAGNEGLLACNQVPILSGGGTSLGSLILFYDKCVNTDEHDAKAMQSLAGLCGLAIEHHQLIARLEYDAVHDPLTGLANRAQLDSQLPKWISNATRHNRVLALMMIDLDGFKTVNDTLGHQTGDLLLRQVAIRLCDSIRESDMLVRTGGDEFTLLATEISSQADVSAVADRLFQSLAAPFVVEGRELFVSASIGMAVFPTDGTDGAALQRCADSAMFAAKAAGRNRALRFEAKMGEAALNRLEMEGQLRRAVSQNEFRLEYQPQVNHRSEIVGVEALVRWHHPQLGPIAPARFIPLAEQCGLVVSIGTWVLHEACRQAMAWQNAGCIPIPVSVNVSAVQFQKEDFLDILKSALNDTGLAHGCLELELTESVLLANTTDTIRKVSAVRELGVSVAIDDFGTGYSSLSYLKKLPIDRLKIDQSFVSDLGAGPISSDGNHTAVITAITTLASSLGMRVVAEGVETPAQRDFLIQIGCDTLQGFLFSRPVNADRLESMLRSQEKKHTAIASAA
jgi:diguanylate cyclase (GGDEF)-like protein/PAS domain S-box-containing protein